MRRLHLPSTRALLRCPSTVTSSLLPSSPRPSYLHALLPARSSSSPSSPSSARSCPPSTPPQPSHGSKLQPLPMLTALQFQRTSSTRQQPCFTITTEFPSARATFGKPPLPHFKTASSSATKLQPRATAPFSSSHGSKDPYATSSHGSHLLLAAAAHHLPPASATRSSNQPILLPPPLQAQPPAALLLLHFPCSRAVRLRAAEPYASEQQPKLPCRAAPSRNPSSSLPPLHHCRDHQQFLLSFAANLPPRSSLAA